MTSRDVTDAGGVPLVELARVIRSKNAKPFYITFDIMFDDHAKFDRVVRSGAIDAGSVARIYRVDPSAVKVIVYPSALAIKATVERWVPAGAFGDRDLLGAQQAVPFYDIRIP